MNPRTLTLVLPVILVLNGCVPDSVNQADRAQIAGQMARINELQNHLSAVTSTTTLLEVVCVTNGLLLAVCLVLLWARSRKKGGPH